MALRFVDSFDHYVTADLAEKWSSVTGSATISASNGRRSTACLRLATLNSVSVVKTLDAQTTWIVGFAFKVGTVGAASGQAIVALLDASTLQLDVRLNPDGTLSVTRNATVLTTSVFALATGTTYYIELKATINNSGSYELRVNGANVTSGSGVDTQNTANATANQIRIGNSSTGAGNANIDYDDLYVCDGTGAANNNFLGDVRVDCLFTNNNGNSSQLVGSDGNSTDNYLLVDEAAPNDDTDYVESSTVGNKDTYAFGNLSHTPASVFGLQIAMAAKKDDAGARSIQSVIRSSATELDGTANPLATTYTYYLQISETDPNTSAAWTGTNVNAAEFGVKVAA